jgi:peptidoglycan/LPS O-acetylase OafA/YrhL
LLEPYFSELRIFPLIAAPDATCSIKAIDSITSVPNIRQIPEIDGLRAIAILLVAFFHAGLPGVTGGYIGVDVFFVISGFLITRLLVDEVAQTGTIDILDFYARRVRRLLPALAVVLFATLVAGALVLTPIGEQQDLAASALATAAFVSNIFFWRTQTGYFAGPAEQLPLLHMWTLAVEEQFYIFWPLAILGTGFIARRSAFSSSAILVAVLVIGSVLSLILSWLVTPVRPTMAFYLTPFRAWEFGIGGLLSLLPWARAASSAKPRLGGGLVFFGLAAIILAAVLFDSNTVFPGFAALLPTLGAGSVILGVILAAGSPVAWLLRATPVVFIGKLSYSWYLWHWPLLAITRAQTLGEHSLPRDIVLIIIALALSALTYRFVEQPVRQLKPWPFDISGQAIMAGLLILASTAALSGAVWASADYLSHHDQFLSALKKAQSRIVLVPVQCTYFQHPFAGLATADGCMIGNGGSPVVLLWGDSHADHLVPALAEQTRLRHMRLLPLTMGGCKPYVSHTSGFASGFARGYEADCLSFNAEVRSSLPKLKALHATVVVLAARWSVPSLWESPREPWERELSNAVGEIRADGLDVVLAADVPDFPKSVPECLARLNSDMCGRRRDEVERDRASAMFALRRIAQQFDRVVIWDPVDQLCDETRCEAMRGQSILYADRHHLSYEGGLSLSRTVGEALDRLAARPRTINTGADLQDLTIVSPERSRKLH